MKENIIDCFIDLGKLFNDLGLNNKYEDSNKNTSKDEYQKFNEVINSHKASNPWFTEKYIRKSILSFSSRIVTKASSNEVFLLSGELNGLNAQFISQNIVTIP